MRLSAEFCISLMRLDERGVKTAWIQMGDAWVDIVAAFTFVNHFQSISGPGYTVADTISA